MIPAAYFETLSDKQVRCTLCPHRCLLTDGKKGICLTRQNSRGKLMSFNYLSPINAAYDPIEKKPLYHFYPGSTIFSTGPNGCTLKCAFCQNSDIAQRIIATHEMPVLQIIGMAEDNDSIGIAYTYSEPYIWFETIMEIAPLIRDSGLKNIMVTNGFFNPEPLKELLTCIDAFNIDIKSIRPDFYKRICKGTLQPVLDSCITVKKSAHLEITNLLVTDENDSEADVEELAQWIAANLGKDTPLHISRYFPRHKMKKPATDVGKLERAGQIASQYLEYVYTGNVKNGKSDTLCPKCKAVLIKRDGYSTIVSEKLHKVDAKTSLCEACQTIVPVVLG